MDFVPTNVWRPGHLDWIKKKRIDVKLRHLLLAAWTMAVFPLALSSALADPSADYLDEVLTQALKGATAEQEAWVAEEKATREARKAEGDAVRAAHAEMIKGGEQAKKLREAAEKEAKEREEAEERRRQMAEEYERELKRDALARQRAAESARARAEANRTIMDAISRNAQGIADAYQTGQDAVAAANREKARIEAQQAARAAEAQYQQQLAAARAQADREARARAEAAKRRAEAARKAAAKANAANGGQQMASTVTSAPRQAPRASTSSASRMASNNGASSEPSKTYRRVEALTYCTYQSDQRPADGDVEWICDGPTQKLQLKNLLRDGLGYAGCGNANTTSRRQTMGKGDIFYCEKAIAPYDRDIASIYNVPATIRGHRHVYECKQTSDNCTRETAVKFIAGGGL